MTHSNHDRLIRLSKSNISSSEILAVQGVLEREFLGMGQEVQKFEEALSAYLGRPAVCVVNGTAALHLAIESLRLSPGDEVLVPSLTYVACFQAIRAAGAIPVACDIRPDTFSIDITDAEHRLTPNTKAIMPVHYSGGVHHLNDIYSFATRNGLRVVEDAAHAFGTVYSGQRVGSFGDVTCFSFDGIKNITCGEGGCIVTNDETVLSHVRDARLLGVHFDTANRFSGQRSWEFDVSHQGWRYHMSNIMASIGLEQLKRFSSMSSSRQQLAQEYDAHLKYHARISFIPNDYSSVVPHIYVIRIHGLTNRPDLRSQLLSKGIQTGIHYQPNHLLSYFKPCSKTSLPVTEVVYPELLTLPLHPEMTNDDVSFVCRELLTLLDS